MSSKSRCTVCNSEDLFELIEIESIPAYCNVMWDSKGEAENAPKGNLVLAFCNICGHVFNRAFDPAVMKYTQAYENSLHFSPKFQEYANALANHLIETYQIKSKSVIDIGCGKGDFLKLICRLGNNNGYGFDRSYVPDNENEKNNDVKFIQDFYSEKYSNYHADLVMCRHVLEHIQFPAVFIANVKKSIGRWTETTVFFEVPNALYTIKDLGIWDLIYEHCSYFTPNSLEHVFSAAGFLVNDMNEYFNGQYLGIETKLGSTINKITDDDAKFQTLKVFAEQFSKSYYKKVEYWKTELEKFQKDGLKTVVWGGGSKGVTLLNIMKSGNYIKYIVDINPRKEGKYVSCTAQEYVRPGFLSNYKPEKVIIMNEIYKSEIEKTLSELGLNSDVLVA